MRTYVAHAYTVYGSRKVKSCKEHLRNKTRSWLKNDDPNLRKVWIFKPPVECRKKWAIDYNILARLLIFILVSKIHDNDNTRVRVLHTKPVWSGYLNRRRIYACTYANANAYTRSSTWCHCDASSRKCCVMNRAASGLSGQVLGVYLKHYRGKNLAGKVHYSASVTVLFDI